MSFSLTTAAMRARTKTVTRRAGWRDLRVGERVQACEKCQGLRPGEAMVKLGVIEIVAVEREPLWAILFRPDRSARFEVDREGFPEMSPDDFVAFFCRSHGEIHPATEVTRIEFRHVDA